MEVLHVNLLSAAGMGSDGAVHFLGFPGLRTPTAALELVTRVNAVLCTVPCAFWHLMKVKLENLSVASLLILASILQKRSSLCALVFFPDQGMNRKASQSTPS